MQHACLQKTAKASVKHYVYLSQSFAGTGLIATLASQNILADNNFSRS